MKKILLTILVLVMTLGTTKSVIASVDRLPEPMTGQSTVYYHYNPDPVHETDGAFYGGFEGNEAVYNYTNEDSNSSGGSGQSKTTGPSISFDPTKNYAQWGDTNTNFGDNTFTLTVSCWFNTRSADNGRIFVSKYAAGSGENSSWYFGMKTSNTFEAKVVTASGAVRSLTSQGTTSLLDTWVHAVFVYNSTTLKIYQDGVLSAATQHEFDADKIKRTSSTPVRIGIKGGEDIGSNFNGMLDDVRIYNSALTDANVATLYSGSYTDSTNLLGSWDFHEGAGDTASDISGNNNNITLHNAPTWILDNSPVVSGGYDLFGFDRTSLTNCINDNLLGGIYNCFVSNSKNNNVKVMSSRTYVNENPVTPVMEMAALYYPPVGTIVGDAYLNGMDPANFAYWGRNLVQNSGSNATNTDSYWGVNNYKNDADVQAQLSGAEFNQYKARISELQGEATPILSSSSLSGDIHLQYDDIGAASSPSTEAQKDKYPNGKVWVVSSPPLGSTTLGSFTFDGVGTIIFLGQVSITSFAQIKAKNPESKLGIIVLNSPIRFGGNNHIEAAVFAAGSGYEGGDIAFSGDDVDLIGSFVAKTFSRLTDTNNPALNIRFYYDKRLDSGWPPGFRYLNMPHPTEN